MTDQPTPEPEPPDDTPDTSLTAAQRTQIRDLAQRMVDNGNASIPDDEQARIARWLWRRAWLRYQAQFEASETDREVAARDTAEEENLLAEAQADDPPTRRT